MRIGKERCERKAYPHRVRGPSFAFLYEGVGSKVRLSDVTYKAGFNGNLYIAYVLSWRSKNHLVSLRI